MALYILAITIYITTWGGGWIVKPWVVVKEVKVQTSFECSLNPKEIKLTIYNHEFSAILDLSII